MHWTLAVLTTAMAVQPLFAQPPPRSAPLSASEPVSLHPSQERSPNRLVSPPPVLPQTVRIANYQATVQPPQPAGGQAPNQNNAPATAEELPPLRPAQIRDNQPASNAWSLQQIELATLEFNPALVSSLALIEAARGLAQQASLYPNPRFDTNNPEVFAGPNSSYNVGFMQDIVVKGKLRLDRAAANEVLAQRQHGLTLDRFTVLLAVRQQFYTVLVGQRRIQVLDEMRESFSRSVGIAEDRQRAGIGTTLEVLLLKAQLQRAEVSLANARITLEADRRRLSAIMGRPDIRIEAVRGELASGFPEFDADAARQFVVSEHAQVQIARREIQRNEFLLRRARVEPYPNVRVGPAYNSNLINSPGSQQFWLTAQFDIPVWNRNQGNIITAQANLGGAIASLGTVQNGLLAQVEDALGRYFAARQLEEKMGHEILPTLAESLRLLESGYRAGEFDFSVVLQAQRSLSEASLNYLETLDSLWSTVAELSKLLQLERLP